MTEPVIYCEGGPYAGRWYLAAGWDIKRAAAQHTLDMAGDLMPADHLGRAVLTYRATNRHQPYPPQTKTRTVYDPGRIYTWPGTPRPPTPRGQT